MSSKYGDAPDDAPPGMDIYGDNELHDKIKASEEDRDEYKRSNRALIVFAIIGIIVAMIGIFFIVRYVSGAKNEPTGVPDTPMPPPI
jgi:hypothetical protein